MQRGHSKYLLQQKNPLPVFGQVVCSEAALDTCPDHNGIPEIFLRGHDAHLLSPIATAPTHKGEGEQSVALGLQRRSRAKCSLASFPTVLWGRVLLPSPKGHRAQPRLSCTAELSSSIL